LEEAREIIHNRLMFVSLPDDCCPPKSDHHRFFFHTDTDLVYQQFFADFGPLHVGHLYTFCRRLYELLKHPQHMGKTIFYYSTEHLHRRSNSVVLILSYAVLRLGKTPEEAYAPFLGIQPPLIPFRDAAFGVCTFHLTVLDCVRAVSRAMKLGHLNLDSFDPDEFAFYDAIENGDINWIIPGKFLAFSGPLPLRREVEPGKHTLLAEDYVPTFKRLGVTCVIRFNKKCYDRRRFLEAGIRHYDLYYADGGNPSEEIFQRFLRICEETKGAIAVHCKAGLGRTGTNIALYMMKHYGYTAAESIAFCRMCRPGSIVGPQQHFLQDLEPRMKAEGEVFHLQGRGKGKPVLLSTPVSCPPPHSRGP
ncbi:unnamed protein product, partial [Discosporangium mesarthrocarpum]